MRHRDPNLDLLRAAAIVMVIISHLAVVWGLEADVLRKLTDLGAYGVDLFFVLSGWLIGGLYFKEQQAFGNVQPVRFWMRRALRTMPPYFIALPFAWLLVHVHRDEAFHSRYLVFLQNYLEDMPFFLASWSLCVEEHFYLLIIPVLGVAAALKFPTPLLLSATAVASPLLRLVDPHAGLGRPFGYADTATHLRLTGIALGVSAAWLACNARSVWERIQLVATWLAIPGLVAFLALAFTTHRFRYYAGPEVVACIAFLLLARSAGRAPLPLAELRPVHAIALASYSLYLTHGMVLQVGRGLGQRVGLPATVTIFMSLLLIIFTGAVYFLLVERTAISLRDRWMPRRVETP